MHRLPKLLVLSALITIMTPLAAAPSIDQNAPTYNSSMSALGPGRVQSFQQAASNIVGAGIFLNTSAGATTTDTVTISLWDNLPNASGSMLASASTTGTAGSWADVFWASVSVVPDTTYYLVFDGNNTLIMGGDANNGYSRGQIYAPGNSGPFSSYGAYDFTFRTYADVAPVPEPETYAMMLAGLGLLGVMARRRKQKLTA